MIAQTAAVIAATLLFGLTCFQISLALGFPFGKAAWGGKYKKLPFGLRIASLFSAAILVFASIIILEKAELISVINSSTVVACGVWIFAAFMGLNTIGNIASRSEIEKRIMTPMSLTLGLLFLVVAVASN